MRPVVLSVVRLAVAALAEIGGAYLVWLWWRDGRPWPLGLLGACALVAYGVPLSDALDDRTS